MKTVFTNGCFDLLHPGHIDLLERAKGLGDRLIVGLNSDASVRSIKGFGRPFMLQDDRASMLRALRCVDEVILFDEPTPARLIEELRPDVLVKGGDWSVEQIVGADIVLRNNGSVLSLPLLPLHSTTALVERICDSHREMAAPVGADLTPRDGVLFGLAESIRIQQRLMVDCGEAIQKACDVLAASLYRGGKALLFGNSGCASIARHITDELVWRFRKQERELPAIALMSMGDTLTLTDHDPDSERIFARQVEALGNPGDCAVAFSISGLSANMLAGIISARQRGCQTIGLTGAKGKKLASLCDAPIMVPSDCAARIQEAQLTIGHLFCQAAATSYHEGHKL